MEWSVCGLNEIVGGGAVVVLAGTAVWRGATGAGGAGLGLGAEGGGGMGVGSGVRGRRWSAEMQRRMAQAARRRAVVLVELVQMSESVERRMARWTIWSRWVVIDWTVWTRARKAGEVRAWRRSARSIARALAESGREMGPER